MERLRHYIRHRKRQVWRIYALMKKAISTFKPFYALFYKRKRFRVPKRYRNSRGGNTRVVETLAWWKHSPCGLALIKSNDNHYYAFVDLLKTCRYSVEMSRLYPKIQQRILSAEIWWIRREKCLAINIRRRTLLRSENVTEERHRRDKDLQKCPSKGLPSLLYVATVSLRQPENPFTKSVFHNETEREKMTTLKQFTLNIVCCDQTIGIQIRKIDGEKCI